MIISLIGMPASGKSTWGLKLAQELHYPFLDLDTYITRQKGKTIAQIFEAEGESVFRQIEQEALLEVFQSHKQLVLATGGGTPCFYDNIQTINEHSISVHLQVPLPILAQRLLADSASHRPLYAHRSPADLLNFLEALWQKRAPYYRQAKFCLTLD